jgi:putative transposase
MGRIARAVAVDLPHHITQRGNFGMTVFADDYERKRYLSWLVDYAQRYGMRIAAYCLMDNHVHFIATPTRHDSFARALNQTHMRYAQWVNRRSGRVGHLWQGRFYSCVLDGPHLFSAVRYVERNPVRAGVVERADEYRWSSARAHVQGGEDGVLNWPLELEDVAPDWAAYLAEPEDLEWTQGLRRAWRTGRPFGDGDFVGRVEQLLLRRLRPKAAGRPRRRPSVGGGEAFG